VILNLGYVIVIFIENINIKHKPPEGGLGEYMVIDWKDINKHKEDLQLEGEVWVTIEEIPKGRFSISNYGRCRRNAYPSSKRSTSVPMIMKVTDNGNGYKKYALTYEYKMKNYYVHRLVAKYFIPNPDNLPQVNHMPTGLGKMDNRAEYLEWCTGKYNISDAHKNGQMRNRTENAGLDKKSDKFIAEMYREYKRSGKVGETARLFGVSRTTLSSIVNKRSRRKITDPIDIELKPT